MLGTGGQTMEVRPIDANKLKEVGIDTSLLRADCKEMAEAIFTAMQSAIDAQPTLDYEPVVHAHWKVITFKNSRKKFIECSKCGATIDCLATSIDEYEYDGCPYCRAKMDEEVKQVC